MRDIIVTLLVVGSLPFILRKPFFGVLVWTWLGLMNPHKLCWGFALTMPYAQMVAIAILVGWFISKEPKQIPWTGLSRLLAVWWAWMLFTSFFALLDPWEQWDKVWKIMLLTFIALALLRSRERIEALVWVCVISLGLYGVKGGIFTLLTGGGYSVYGPAGTFIGGNNEIGLALIMTVPLMRYLQLTSASKPVKLAMTASIVLTLLSIVATHSRGAFLGLFVMVGYLLVQSRNKGAVLLLIVLALPAIFVMMPEEYFGRMETIQSFQEDRSAMGRINAWWTAFYIALDRPFVGGGFEVFRPLTFVKYAPDPNMYHDAHSIYFEVLGEHGFIGLALFLSLGLGSLITLGRVKRFAGEHESLTWMRDLASLLRVSLVGYATAGAFLGLAYFDFYYTLVAITVALSVLAERYRAEGIPEPAQAAPPAVGNKAARQDRRQLKAKPSPLKRAADWYDKL